MKTLYLECNMGAAGDMIASALFELFDDKEALEKEVNAIGLPDTVVRFEKKKSCAVNGIHARVICNGEEEGSTEQAQHHSHHMHRHSESGAHHHTHSHKSLSEIFKTIDALTVTEKVKSDAKNIYDSIAEAESAVHAEPVSEIHFHEVGMLDAIADVVVCSYLFNKINADRITASPINVGNGAVDCAHGTLPVPAPATANLLIGIPFYKSEIYSELCTPTGAAVLKYFVNEFTSSPDIISEKIGCGIGSKEFSQANMLRAFLSGNDRTETICELVCNIDDMTAEELSFACEAIFNAGAAEVFTTPVYMKKNRAAVLLTVLCSRDKKSEIIRTVFKNTRTIGIREHLCTRYALDRKTEKLDTPLGEMIVKKSSRYEAENMKIEYESLKEIAEKNGITLLEAKELLQKYLSEQND